MQLKSRLALCAAVLCGAISCAQAHNIWLLPSSTVLSKAEWITVDAAVSNDMFFFNHVPLALDNLTVTAPDGSAVQPENAWRGKLRSVFDLNLTQTGTYRLAVVNSGLFASYKDKATGQPRRWRGTPEMFAAQVPTDALELRVTQSAGRVETFVTVGKPSAIKPTGQGLELVPVTHPNDLAQGEKATFVLQVDGKPAAGLGVAIALGGTRYRDKIDEIKTTTDAAGQFSVTWPAAGMYWIDADTKDDKTSLPQVKERRLFYVGTFEVLP
ncbi:DUF4198 domain-containing protein [Ramlibacter sp. H39-3-26]|uniref:DUF4198 domain-containing protein n=1 Tax=Curvibacter soli TaxID=3031331 RepID=UPI0023DA8955|nr:DUF4198 domain-containing protein [Ramlibacter sp. H39-3-26]MDF1485855.1 DUF4198 domain-containing protein [Ramlibacter sp. H39-3-26]